MPKTLKIISIILFFFSLLPVVSSQADSTDSIRIVTYYPSPFGTYRELRTKRMAIGDDYIKTGAPPDKYDWQEYPTDPMHNIGYDADLVVQGNVGIGTTTPGASLHIHGGNGLYLDAGTDMGGTQLNFITYGNGKDGLNNAATKGWHIYARGNDYASIPNQENDLGLAFYDGLAGTNVMQMDSVTGNVGIGTTSPRTSQNSRALRLDVTDNIVTNDVYLASPRSGSARWASEGGGGVVQMISTNYTGTMNSAGIPWDNTIPLYSEGSEILTYNFIPKYADSMIRIDVVVSGDEIGQTTAIVALFKDTTCVDAIASYGHDSPHDYNLLYTESSGSTSARIYSVRVGNMRVNSSNDIANPPLGGKYISKMIITEIRT